MSNLDIPTWKGEEEEEEDDRSYQRLQVSHLRHPAEGSNPRNHAPCFNYFIILTVWGGGTQVLKIQQLITFPFLSHNLITGEFSHHLCGRLFITWSMVTTWNFTNYIRVYNPNSWTIHTAAAVSYMCTSWSKNISEEKAKCRLRFLALFIECIVCGTGEDSVVPKNIY